MQALFNKLSNFRLRLARHSQIRKLLTHVSIVLEIGSGNNPQSASSIRLDKYAAISTHVHRTSSAEIHDLNSKPFILGDGGKLPFKNKSIDVIICRHVIEHVDNPVEFVQEIQRVGKRGYLEWPSIYTELISGGFGEQNKIQQLFSEDERFVLKKLEHGQGTRGHKWFIVPLDNTVFFIPKTKDLYPLYLAFGAYSKSIGKYKIHPQISSISWSENSPIHGIVLSGGLSNQVPETIEESYDLQGQIGKLKETQSSVNTSKQWASIDELKILCCPYCKKGDLTITEPDTLTCPICKRKYPWIGNVRVFLD